MQGSRTSTELRDPEKTSLGMMSTKTSFPRIFLIVSILHILILLAPPVGAIYCGEDDCYDLLG